jgi:NFU1 iron-sulfur cluster scaffold homolog, mitochondrial
MSNDIKIQAQIVAQDTCQFKVDRPIYEAGSVYFAGAEEAAGSPLIEKIFAIPNVTAVLVLGNIIKVTKNDQEDWVPVAKQVGSIIREQLTSGEPAIADAVKNTIPSDEEIRQKVSDLIEKQINPAVASHGGYVELVDVKKNNIYLQLGGGCQGCGMANVTLRQGIEKMIRQYIPQVGGVLDVTDHASGTNPFYGSS